MNLFGPDFSREGLLNRLREFCKHLTPGSEIIIIGAAAIILSIETERKTLDLDILNTVETLAYSKFDIQIVNEDILFLCSDYRDRLTFVNNFSGVDVYTLGLLDVALVKLGRGLEKDFDDIHEILNSGTVAMNEFISKYVDFRKGYGGNVDMLDEHFRSVTGITPKKDERMF